ncbi:hypothetical protein MESS4_40002 [Mesorhizobium sp. STM 4661]|nr:hypothetical protein MESS4_40002 [Mesorhizobium sp. STM 4661]
MVSRQDDGAQGPHFAPGGRPPLISRYHITDQWKQFAWGRSLKLGCQNHLGENDSS